MDRCFTSLFQCSFGDLLFVCVSMIYYGSVSAVVVVVRNRWKMFFLSLSCCWHSQGGWEGLIHLCFRPFIALSKRHLFVSLITSLFAFLFQKIMFYNLNVFCCVYAWTIFNKPDVVFVVACRRCLIPWKKFCFIKKALINYVFLAADRKKCFFSRSRRTKFNKLKLTEGPSSDRSNDRNTWPDFQPPGSMRAAVKFDTFRYFLSLGVFSEVFFCIVLIDVGAAVVALLSLQLYPLLDIRVKDLLPCEGGSNGVISQQVFCISFW